MARQILIIAIIGLTIVAASSTALKAEDTGWKSPSAAGSIVDQWNDETYVFSSNNIYANDYDNGSEDQLDVYNFNFSFTGVSSIDGIFVQVEAKGPTTGKTLYVKLSWNGGTSWTTAKSTVFTNVEQYQDYGDPADTWGRSWSSSDFSNTNFRLMIYGSTETGILYVDHIRVKVYYSKDETPPTMESILEPQGQYYNTVPTFANFGFDDDYGLDDGWYQMDSYFGSWIALFTDVSGTEWNSDGWTIPGFDALSEGSHIIYFKASDDAGNIEGESGEWSWQFYKDTQPPNDPTNVASTSHTVSTWSNDNTVDITWTDATDPAGSGLDGYSILWNTSPNTIPDAIKDIEEGVEATTSPTLADGNSHYFHIRSVDNAGNWQSTVHLGPFYIDITPPNDPTDLTSTNHTPSVWLNHNTVEVSWTAATDVGTPSSGVDGYSYAWDTNAGTIPDQVKDIEETVTGLTSPVLADGNSHYFHIRTVDNASNWTSTEHLGPFYIDVTDPIIIYNWPSAGDSTNWYSSDPGNVIDIDFGWVANSPLDLAEWKIGAGAWNTIFTVDHSSNYTTNWAVTWNSLSEGNNEISIRVTDKAGNLVTHVFVAGTSGFIFRKDTQPPGDPTNVTSPSHTSSAWSNDNTVDVTWTAAVDPSPGSGLDGYSILWDTSPTTVPDAVKDIEENVTNFTSPVLADGNNHYFHIRSVDNAGNWQSTVHLGPFFIDATPPSNPISCSETHGAPNNAWQRTVSDPNFTWSGASDSHSGVHGYYYYWGTNPNGTLSNYTTSAGYNPPSVSSGTYYLRVRTKDNAGNRAGWKTLFTFKYDDTAPSNPTTCTETHGVSNNTWQNSVNDPSFTWSGASDAHSGVHGYYYYWGTNPNGTSSNYTTSAGYNPPSVSSGTYYLRVRTKDNVGNMASWKALFTFKYDAIAPSIPTLVSPLDGSATNDSTPSFIWNTSIDELSQVAHYVLEYAYDSSFTSMVSETVFDTVYTPSLSLPDSTYYWRVKAIDMVSNESNWSQVWHFVLDTREPGTPILLSPLGGVYLNNTLVVFQWTEVTLLSRTNNPFTKASGTVASEVRYVLEIDTTILFVSSLVIDTAYATSDTLILEEHNYYWRAKAYDLAGNEGSFSNMDSFSVDVTPPSIPTLVSPPHGSATNDSTPTFIWNASTDNLSGVNYYTLQYADNPDFFGAISVNIIDTTYVLTSSLPDTVYYWHVKAIDVAANQSDWSETWSFAIDTDVPDVPTLVSPANSSYTNDNTPTFIWTKVTTKVSRRLLGTPVSYTIECALDSAFTDTVFIDGLLTDTAYAVSDPLSDTIYYWHVEAVDQANNHSGYQERPFQFIVDTQAPQVEIVSPNGGESWVTGETDTIKWIATDKNGIDSLSILYSISGGFDWDTLSTGEANDSAYVWHIDTALSSPHCLVRIIAFDPSLNIGMDTSDSLFAIVVGIEESLLGTPSKYSLSQNHPNPFSRSTEIRYSCPSSVPVSLKIYDLSGRLVRTLVDEPITSNSYEPYGQSPHPYGQTITTYWDGRNDSGKLVSSGVYFYKLKTDKFTATRKLILLR